MTTKNSVTQHHLIGGNFPLTFALAALLGLGVAAAQAQTSFTSTTATSAWNAARWNNTTDAAPYTSAFTANNAVSFTSGSYTFAGMGATTNVGNVTVAPGVSVSFSSIGSTYATGGLVRTINVGAGGLFDLSGNSVSTAGGTGLIKSGDGVFGTGAGAFAGGFTLNAGTVIARGTTGLGSGATNALTLNGGVLAANASRVFDSTRFGGGITIGGDVQIGALATAVTLSNSTANIALANNVSLGGVARTLTQGSNGAHGFSGIVSNTGSGGITFAALPATDGRFEISNAANTFTGDININGGEVRFTSDGSLGNAANDVIIDGGRFATANAVTYTLGAGRQIFVGDGADTGISTPGTGTLTYNGVIANKTGETGSWAKQGGGTLALAGASTYTGATAINNGIVQLTTGNDRLPTGTTVSLGQAASANLGTLDLNGRSQAIVGLNSTSGTNAGSSNNTVTSTGTATLTITGSGSFGDGTAANSGVISGAISLVKSVSGTQVLGDDNTFTGSTTITGGTLTAAAAQSTHEALGDTSAISVTGGTLLLGASNQIAKAADLTLDTGGIFDVGGFTEADSLTFSSTTNGLGSLILANTATLALTGTSIVQFGGVGTQNGTLQITGYSAGDRLLFSGLASTFTSVYGFNEVSFNGGFGYEAIQFDTNQYYEIVPVPEPATIFGAIGLLGLVSFRERRRLMTLFSRLAPKPSA